MQTRRNIRKEQRLGKEITFPGKSDRKLPGGTVIIRGSSRGDKAKLEL